MWFSVVCTLIDKYTSLLFSQTFFSYCFCMLSVQKYLKGKSDAYLNYLVQLNYLFQLFAGPH